MTSKTMKRKGEPVWMLFVGLALIVWTLVGICLPQPKSGESGWDCGWHFGLPIAAASCVD